MNEITGRLARLPGLVLRFGRVAAVVCGYAVLIGGSALGARLRRGRDGRGLRDGDRWVRMLTRLGPSYIKIGQLLSTRRDLLPAEVTTPLARLTDAASPPSRRRIERAVRRAYRDRPWPFREFGWQPVACGSIATVHEAVTWDGRRVAVKVRRPGIERVMRQDFALAASAMTLLGVLPRLRRMPFKLMHAQVGGAILRQLDFAAEAASLAALRANLAGFDNVRIPEPLPELCTAETVVMEYVTDLTRFEPGELDADTRRAVVRAVLAAIYEMLFVDGLVHCDLHPGNLYFDHRADLVMLDAGFVIRLPDPVRRSFADFFINMALGDGWMCAQVVIESAAHVADDCDLEGFRAGLGELVAETSGAKSGEFDLARFAGRLFDLQRRFGLFPAPEFAFPLLSLLVIEGMIKVFDSDVDFQAEAVPILRRRNTPRAAESTVER
ncbi:ABC1 kinase family protein [Saccharothrix australiensis]|uniref:2-octaprenylphenol hydroxylase n=1 Tax=Saccharothrix australiensis TaxID=2072 RepID=A0A495W0H7_9PSEU|nr:AarF/UbiB family protein [Saccharothrix australiensis]RKT55201.1 2-octaprenylphenol hydroxylase [Saccharothrix australiensis]